MELSLAVLEEWRDAGAYMQVNAGSFTGSYGARAKRLVWAILEEGNADYICSDYHSRGKCAVAAAISQMKDRGYGAQVSTLQLNGRRILRDEAPLRVEPFTGKPRPGWKKVFPWA
jgi:tyrosine-protein phosphatase YwqE